LHRADGIRQQMPKGGVVLRINHDVHAVQPDVFLRTYRLAEDGRELDAITPSISSIDS